MSKKNKKQYQNPTRQQPQKNEVVTIEEAAETTNQTDFNAQKEQLLDGLKKELSKLEEQKKDLENKIDDLHQEFEQKKEKLTAVQDEIRPLNEQLAESRKLLSQAETKKKEEEEKASKILDSARLEADHIIENSRAEARAKLENQLAELNAAREEVRKASKELDKRKSELENQEDDIDIAREVLENDRKNLNKRKVLYDKASPTRIETLTVELHDSQERYEALRTKYDEQSERIAKIELLLDSIKNETNYDVKSIIIEFERLNARNAELEQILEKYPDEKRLHILEEAEDKCKDLEKNNEELKRSCTRYKEQLKAYENSQRELEIVRREIDVINALNDHLLKELESHKTALESRTGDTCPALTKVDSEAEAPEFKQTIVNIRKRNQLTGLEEIVTHVRNFSGSRKNEERLFYTDDDIRAFLAGMAVSRLLILQGMSGTGKSSLPRIFSEAISGFNRLIPVESSWRDRNELLGYYNDFNKKFNAKSFTIELYRSGRNDCKDIPAFIVLDEMNLARMEYYFSDFLAVLESVTK
jgi:predicted  nucleic acid-binding Zn-ribbon protein